MTTCVSHAVHREKTRANPTRILRRGIREETSHHKRYLKDKRAGGAPHLATSSIVFCLEETEDGATSHARGDTTSPPPHTHNTTKTGWHDKARLDGPFLKPCDKPMGDTEYRLA